VLVDDLTTHGTREPYRMFTSRAEYRLMLREDNADARLTARGRELGLVDDERWAFFNEKHAAIEREVTRLSTRLIRPTEIPSEWATRVIGGPLSREQTAFELLRRPEVSVSDLEQIVGATDLTSLDERIPAQLRLELEVRARYAGYIDRQQADIERQRGSEETALPTNLDYTRIAGLSNEVRQKLSDLRPATLGQASRVPGVTPAAISILIVHLKRARAA
jgi:tRNA uridine 5-carboxymethylaminomethyl modification enzyme